MTLRAVSDDFQMGAQNAHNHDTMVKLEYPKNTAVSDKAQISAISKKVVICR